MSETKSKVVTESASGLPKTDSSKEENVTPGKDKPKPTGEVK